VAAGGELREFETPLSAIHGIQVVTDWSHYSGASQVLRELSGREDEAKRDCLLLEEVATRSYPDDPVHITAADSPSDRPPEWLVSGPSTSQYRNFVFPDGPPPIGVQVDVHEGTGTTYVHTITGSGEYRIYELPSLSITDQPIAFPSEQGGDCAARVASNWWVVDPTHGTLFTTDPVPGWIPARQWTGIAQGPGEQLVLASADQELWVFDAVERRLLRRFPAAVWPSRRFWVNECSQVVAGSDWYATFNHMTSLLTVYDREGRWMGSRRLNEMLNVRYTPSMKSVAGAGGYLAVSVAGTVKTLRVTFAKQCDSMDSTAQMSSEATEPDLSSASTGDDM